MTLQFLLCSYPSPYKLRPYDLKDFLSLNPQWSSFFYLGLLNYPSGALTPFYLFSDKTQSKFLLFLT